MEISTIHNVPKKRTQRNEIRTIKVFWGRHHVNQLRYIANVFTKSERVSNIIQEKLRCNSALLSQL